jgi:hypothetical protein
MNGKVSFPDWFCLRDGRRNFQIDPVQDKDQLFGQPEWEAEIDDRLRKSELLGTPVRLVWWGQYGIGKTHRLRHTEYLIQTKQYKYFPCYVVASDVQEKTGFERLHYELVNELGKDQMREYVQSYVLKVANRVPGIQSLKELCGSSADVAAALETFGGTSDRVVAPAWRFLCGATLEKGEPDVVGSARPKLDRATDYATAIGALATIIEVETGRQLFYLIDEGENLLRITNKAAEASWNEALRSVLDIKNLSMVITVGAEKSDSIPVLILKPDIVRRIQKDNYVQMEAFKTPVTVNFVKGLLQKWVDSDKRQSLEQAANLTANSDYDSTVYPFTKKSFQTFCDGASLDPRSAKPSEILAKLNNVAAEAYFKDQRLISRDVLASMGFA